MLYFCVAAFKKKDTTIERNSPYGPMHFYFDFLPLHAYKLNRIDSNCAKNTLIGNVCPIN